jgi:serine/threonine-protein kinase
VYSLGAVLYEMLTGEPPYTGSTAQAIVARVITEEPRSITLQRRTVPPYVADAVHKALNKLPADRFSNAASFAEALVTPGYVTPSPTRAGEAAVSAPRTLPRGLLVAAALGVLAAVAAFVLGRTTAPAPGTRIVRFTVEDSLLGGPCCGTMVALSPDGRLLVAQRQGEDGPQVLVVRSLDGHEIRTLPGTEEATAPFFSPDGRWLGFEEGGRLRKVALAGGPPITIADVGDRVRGASWGTHDSIVFANDRDDKIYRVSASGGTPERITDGPDGSWHRNPWFLPGNRRVLFALDDNRPNDLIRIGVLDIDSRAVDTLETPGTMARFAPPNHLVFTGSDGSLLIQPFDPGRGRPTGSAVALLDGVLLRGDGTGEFSVSEAGDLVYVPGSGGGAESLVLTDGTSRDNLELPRAVSLEDPATSPDGRRVAVRLPNEGDAEDVWLFDRDQGTLSRFTTEGGTFMPVWTPDGRRIAYGAPPPGDSLPAAIFWRAADGSGGPELLVRSAGPIGPLGFLPDGRRLLVQAWGVVGQRDDIGIFNLGDTAIVWLVATEFNERHGSVSPDGRWLAYASNRSGQSEVYVQALSGQGGRFQISTGGGHSPRWSPDGRRLYHSSGLSAAGGITAADLEIGDRIVVRSREVVFRGALDFNRGNVNYDVDRVNGNLLVILFSGEAEGRNPLRWILGWPTILQEMATAR